MGTYYYWVVSGDLKLFKVFTKSVFFSSQLLSAERYSALFPLLKFSFANLSLNGLASHFA